MPLDEINAASAREKSIRHGHPSTLHLWWARRPLAAARAVIFSSLITDPGDPEYPWRDGQERDVEGERQRLHDLIAELVKWENSTNERVLKQARDEIARHTDGNPPPLLDPFAGGGAIPLEAQRLGLEAHASDLNPVAVLINKAMIEIPPKFAEKPPVNPEQRQGRLDDSSWPGATGLAEDVRYYGKWMRDEAERRIGRLYPKVPLPKEQGGGEAMVIAWLWARTVTCPNPACGAEMPLVRSFILSKKKGSEHHVVPHVRPDRSGVDFEVRKGKIDDEGTVNRKGARCLICDTAVPFKYLRAEGKVDRMWQQLMAIVAEGNRRRVYVSPNSHHESVALGASSTWEPTGAISHWPGRTNVVEYGMTTFGDLFTERQLVALTTFSDLVGEARERVLADAIAAGMPDDGTRLVDGGCGASAYADAIATYLAFTIDKGANLWSTIASWMNDRGAMRETFARQSLPMVWDFAEANPFSNAGGNMEMFIDRAVDVIAKLPSGAYGDAQQADAVRTHADPARLLVSTDPPYYDNIGYADLSDFFYVWLRRTLIDRWPSLFTTLLVPKSLRQ